MKRVILPFAIGILFLGGCWWTPTPKREPPSGVSYAHPPGEEISAMGIPSPEELSPTWEKPHFELAPELPPLPPQMDFPPNSNIIEEIPQDNPPKLVGFPRDPEIPLIPSKSLILPKRADLYPPRFDWGQLSPPSPAFLPILGLLLLLLVISRRIK